ncbi:hypothetical protein K440DRAFT_612597, partial [Wilcoxina mikolae CBS 423.85]
MNCTTNIPGEVGNCTIGYRYHQLILKSCMQVARLEWPSLGSGVFFFVLFSFDFVQGL